MKIVLEEAIGSVGRLSVRQAAHSSLRKWFTARLQAVHSSMPAFSQLDVELLPARRQVVHSSISSRPCSLSS